MIEPCVCGGSIHATTAVPMSEAVRVHNMSLTHVVWRAGREGPTAVADTRDVSADPPRASAPPALGPCECQGCGMAVWWNRADGWFELGGVLHQCRAAVR